MIYTFLLAISFFIPQAYASRSVPFEYTNGIENKLPANYEKLFRIQDKDSPEYTVVAHELAMDLMFIAEQARKSGNLSLSFDFLKLANFIFPHRGDISKKFQDIAEQVTLYLNAPTTPCSDLYEIMLRDLKTHFPAMVSLVDIKKCEQITTAVRDINADILAMEKQGANKGMERSLGIKKELSKLMGKEALSAEEQKRALALLQDAYLGYIEFKSQDISPARDGSVRVSFELIRKFQSLSFQGWRNTYANFTGTDFVQTSNINLEPMKFEMRFIENDKITTYPLTMKIKNPVFFNIWLNSINFFAYSGYPVDQIAYMNDAYSVDINVKGLKLEFFRSVNLVTQFNQFEISGVPSEIAQNVKKVDIIPAP